MAEHKTPRKDDYVTGKTYYYELHLRHKRTRISHSPQAQGVYLYHIKNSGAGTLQKVTQ